MRFIRELWEISYKIYDSDCLAIPNKETRQFGEFCLLYTNNDVKMTNISVLINLYFYEGRHF